MGAELAFPSSETLPDALIAAAERGFGEYVIHLAEGPLRLSSAELAERAGHGARALARRGVEPGDPVGILGPNSLEWIVWAFATWTAGAILVPLQFPLRVRNPDAVREQLHSLIQTAKCKVVLAALDLQGLLPSDVAMPWRQLPATGTYEAPVRPHEVAVVQFTSGSTRTPKGVLITHSAVLASMRAHYDVILDWNPSENSWLMWAPFFHDLGLFMSVVAPTAFGGTAHVLPTERFARAPTQWLTLIGDTRSTWTVAPCSAWAAAVRGTLRQELPVDLSSLRFAGFGGEAIDPDEVSRLLRESSRLKLDPAALVATYGLAEAVLGATVTRPDDGIRIDRIDPFGVAESGRAVPAAQGSVRRLVSCGRRVLGMELRIAKEGEAMPDRHIGEIQLRGKSIMQGYLGSTDDDPFEDGWLRTGDLGYVADGELYVTGRSKDVMIVMGHNYYPDDFEWAASRVEGVRAGRCVAFAADAAGEGGVVLLVEPARGSDPEALALSVRQAVFNAVGVQPQAVFVVPRGGIQVTTSGKLRRSAMREAFLRGQLQPIATNAAVV